MADLPDNEWNEAQWKQAIYAIFDRSIEDPSFRQACVSDPQMAFEQVGSPKLPDYVDVRFDASRDSASIPSFKDAFDKRRPVTIELPQTKTVHSVTANL